MSIVDIDRIYDFKYELNCLLKKYKAIIHPGPYRNIVKYDPKYNNILFRNFSI